MSYAKHYSCKVLIDKLNNWTSQLEGQLDAALSHVADEIESDAQTNARKRTGKMANMTTKKPVKRGNAIGYEVSGTAPYTIFQHEGTRYIQGDPYILNAFNAHSAEVFEAVAKVMQIK
jgi:HK97 gp10 family phage protein